MQLDKGLKTPGPIPQSRKRGCIAKTNKIQEFL